MGIKGNIPAREIKDNWRGDNDEITEWLTIEIPTQDRNNLKITNLYIPPVKKSKDRREEADNTVIDISKWPKNRSSIILGDVNAHSPVWDDACLQRPEL